MKNISQVLKGHGLSVTAQRIAVAEIVDANPHITADKAVTMARARLGVISKQAVYDVLRVLSEKGVLRRIQPSRSPARYESRVGDNHHHLVCRGCGIIRDVACATGETPCLHAIDDHGFKIDEAEVIYWGRCPQCSQSDS